MAPNEIKTIFARSNRVNQACSEAEPSLRASLEAAGLEVVDSFDGTAGQVPDLVILLGGDGFLMEFLRDYGFPRVPIFGVNFGTVGFLMNPHDTLDDIVSILKQRRFETAKHRLLRANFRLVEGEERTLLAFNEVLLERQTGQSVRLEVAIDDVPFHRFAGDGVLISSPAGSTAYNLAAGGPALHPGVRGIVLTPLYPHRAEPFHSLQFSMVLPAESRVTVVPQELPKRRMRLVADGQASRDVARVEVSPSEHEVTLLRTYDQEFIRSVSQKFIG